MSIKSDKLFKHLSSISRGNF